MSVRGVEHTYSEEEIDDVYHKLALIETKDYAIKLLGNPNNIFGIGYWEQTKETVDYQHLIIQETHCYSNVYSTISLRIHYYFDGDMGYHISPA
jgi:hypothetical protein